MTFEGIQEIQGGNELPHSNDLYSRGTSTEAITCRNRSST